MENSVNIFGQDGSQDIAKQILGSDILNAAPSPSNPVNVPPTELAKHYALLTHTAYQIRKLDTDPSRSEEIQTLVTFAERVYSELAMREDEFTDLAPAASTQPPSTSAAPPQPGIRAMGQQQGQPGPTSPAQGAIGPQPPTAPSGPMPAR